MRSISALFVVCCCVALGFADDAGSAVDAGSVNDAGSANATSTVDAVSPDDAGSSNDTGIVVDEELVRQLEIAPLVSSAVELEYPESTSAEESEDRGFWKKFKRIIPWLRHQVQNRCKCAGLACNCCFKFNWLIHECCLGVEHVPRNRKARLNLAFNSHTALGVMVPLVTTERICGTMPAPLTAVNYCLAERSNQLPNGVITLCLSLELRLLTQTGATIQFRCIEFNRGRVTIGGMPEADHSAIVNLAIKDPFKKALALFNKIRR